MTAGNLSAAIRLLDAILETAPGGRVFTSEEAVAAGAEIGLTPGHVYKLLSELTARGSLERPRGHLYIMQPPFGGAAPVRPLAIGVRAVNPAAVSGDTARIHWGLQDQAPLREEVVSTPARIQWTRGVHADGGDCLWSVAGGTIRFRRVSTRDMFGITTVRLDSETVVPMFDRERTILELLTRRDAAEMEMARELIDTRAEDLDFGRLRRYAGRLGIADIATGTAPSLASRA